MATEITSLIIKADSSEIRKADRDLDKLTTSAGRAERAKDALRKGAVALAAGLTVVTVAATALTVAMVKMSLASLDGLAKTADRLGIATEELAGLHLAAKLAGASAESLNNSLEFLANNASEAAKGIGTALDAFRDLNIDAKEFMTLSPDQQMRVLAEAMKGVATQGEKIQIARDLFGRSGAQMVNLLDNGSAALDEATKRAIAYGTAISRVDAAKIEAANDAITEAKTAFEGMGATLTVQLAPYIKAIADGLSNASLEANGFRDSIVSGMEIAAKAIGKVADTFWGIRLTLKLIEIGSLSTKASLLALEGPSKELAVTTFNLLTANQEMDKLLEHKPSEDLANFFLKIKAGAHNAAQAIAAAAAERNKLGGGGLDGFKFDDSKSDISSPTSLTDLIGRNPVISTIELEKEAREAYLEWNFSKDQEAESQEEAHRERLNALQYRYEQNRTAIQQAADTRALNAKNQFFSDLAGLMNTSNKKMFEIGKVAAIAQATLQGYQAIMSAYTAGMASGGPWTAAAYAAAAGLATANMIANIASSSFGGGGGPAASIGQGSSGYSSGGYFSQPQSSSDNTNVLMELAEAIKGLQGISPGQVVTMGVSQAGGLVAVAGDSGVSELAHEITGSVYV